MAKGKQSIKKSNVVSDMYIRKLVHVIRPRCRVEVQSLCNADVSKVCIHGADVTESMFASRRIILDRVDTVSGDACQCSENKVCYHFELEPNRTRILDLRQFDYRTECIGKFYTIKRADSTTLFQIILQGSWTATGDITNRWQISSSAFLRDLKVVFSDSATGRMAIFGREMKFIFVPIQLDCIDYDQLITHDDDNFSHRPDSINVSPYIWDVRLRNNSAYGVELSRMSLRNKSEIVNLFRTNPDLFLFVGRGLSVIVAALRNLAQVDSIHQCVGKYGQTHVFLEVGHGATIFPHALGMECWVDNECGIALIKLIDNTICEYSNYGVELVLQFILRNRVYELIRARWVYKMISVMYTAREVLRERIGHMTWTTRRRPFQVLRHEDHFYPKAPYIKGWRSLNSKPIITPDMFLYGTASWNPNRSIDRWPDFLTIERNKERVYQVYEHDSIIVTPECENHSDRFYCNRHRQ